MHDIFYFTDVHGMYDLYKAAMNYCNEQNPEAMIIFGGDACDRGPDGYKIMKELLNNPKVVYLKGNHEDMFVHAAWFILNDYHGEIEEEQISNYLIYCEIEDNFSMEVQQALYNGGYRTIKDWMMDGMPSDFVNCVAHLPITFSYENIDFCHAGGNYKAFTRAAADEYEDEFVDKDDLMDLIWDRNYLGQGWAPNRICIFGHTPTPHIAAKYYGKDKSLTNVHPCAYYGQLDDKWTGRKIDMDTGTFNSGRLFVLNVLTMKTQGFKDTDFKNEEISKHNIEKIDMIQF